MREDPATEMRRPARLHFKDQVLYGLGHFGISVLGYLVVARVMPFYDPPAKDLAEGARKLVSSTILIGLVLLVSRLVDLIADPLTGFLSDRTRTRWGRRKPFMFVSAPLLVICFILLWRPPISHPSNLNALYALVMLVLMFGLYAAYAAPYLGLLPEIALGRRERLQVAAVQGFFNLAGIGTAAIGVASLTPHYGAARAATLVALACLPALWLPCVGPQEHESVGERKPKLPLLRALRYTFINLPFLVYWCAYYLCWVALLVIVASMEYVAAAFLNLPAGGSGGLVAIPMIGGALFLPVAQWLGARRGVRWTLLASMLWLAADTPFLVIVGTSGSAHLSLWQVRIVMAALSPAVGGLFSLPYPILAEICDRDYKRTGYHREAMFFGLQGTMMKGGLGMAPLVVALIMHLTGAGPDRLVGYHLFGPAAALLALLGFLIFLLYPGAPKASEQQPSAALSGD